MNNVLVVFAMREELAAWRRWRRFRRHSYSPHPIWTTTLGATQVLATYVGAGARDIASVEAITTAFSPSTAIITGVAAGLKPEWRPGDLLAAQAVTAANGSRRISSDPRLIQLASQCGAKIASNLVTVPRVARTPEEKNLLAKVGDAADMESLQLLQQWSTRGLPSLALRVILDPVEMPITTDFENTMDAHGQVQILKILAQLIRQPRLLPDFLHLARESRRSLSILAVFLDRFLEGLELPSTLAARQLDESGPAV